MHKALFFSLILIAKGSAALATETKIPLPYHTGITLGRGFDMRTMEWRDTCIAGQQVASSPSSESLIEIEEGLISAKSLEQGQGSLSAGISLMGGLIGSAKAKTTFISTSLETSRSTS